MNNEMNVANTSTRSIQSSKKREETAATRERQKIAFTSLSIPYAELYLYKAYLVRPYHVTPFKPPFPVWYDKKDHCDYHDDVPGNSTENYIAFKKVVQNLMNTGILKFEDPRVASNILPSHGGHDKNIIEDRSHRRAKRNIAEGSRIPTHRLSDCTKMTVHQTLGREAET